MAEPGEAGAVDLGGVTRRSDAQRNRERIVAAALEELARDGEVALSVIAKRAGVGQGTLYRNFPDRESLVLEVYGREVAQLVERADSRLAAGSAAEALRDWLSDLAWFATLKSGLSEALRTVGASGAGGGREHPGYAPVRAAAQRLLAANHAAGTVRPDVDIDGFLLLVAGIWLVDRDGDWRAQAALVADVVLAGLRPGAGADPAAR